MANQLACGKCGRGWLQPTSPTERKFQCTHCGGYTYAPIAEPRKEDKVPEKMYTIACTEAPFAIFNDRCPAPKCEGKIDTRSSDDGFLLCSGGIIHYFRDRNSSRWGQGDQNRRKEEKKVAIPVTGNEPYAYPGQCPTCLYVLYASKYPGFLVCPRGHYFRDSGILNVPTYIGFIPNNNFAPISPKEPTMAKGKLYLVSVLFHPKEKRDEAGNVEPNPSALLVKPNYILAAGEREARIIASKMIPDTYSDKLEQVETIIMQLNSTVAS